MSASVFIKTLLTAGALFPVYAVRLLAVPGEDGWIGWMVP